METRGGTKRRELSSKERNGPNEQSEQRCCEERKRRKESRIGTGVGARNSPEGGMLGFGSAQQARTEVILRFWCSHWLVLGARTALLPKWAGSEAAEWENRRTTRLYGMGGKRRIMGVERAADSRTGV